MPLSWHPPAPRPPKEYLHVPQCEGGGVRVSIGTDTRGLEHSRYSVTIGAQDIALQLLVKLGTVGENPWLDRPPVSWALRCGRGLK
jgi:hypothetical protein